MRENAVYKSIQGYEALQKFLDKNPGYFVIDTRNHDNRYRVCSESDRWGLSVDGRSVRVLASTGKVKIHIIPWPPKREALTGAGEKK